MIGDNGRLQYLRFCLFEMYVSVVFVIRCLYSGMSLTLVREQRFIIIIIDNGSKNINCSHRGVGGGEAGRGGGGERQQQKSKHRHLYPTNN